MYYIPTFTFLHSSDPSRILLRLSIFLHRSKVHGHPPPRPYSLLQHPQDPFTARTNTWLCWGGGLLCWKRRLCCPYATAEWQCKLESGSGVNRRTVLNPIWGFWLRDSYRKTRMFSLARIFLPQKMRGRPPHLLGENICANENIRVLRYESRSPNPPRPGRSQSGPGLYSAKSPSISYVLLT